MKKQFLILMFFVLALFAGSLTSFGQVLAPSTFGTKPIPLTLCVGSAQQPKAGVDYTYALDPTGSVKAPTGYQFWATKDPNFISLVGGVTTLNQAADSLKKTQGQLINYSPNYKTGGATSSVHITWSPEILAGTKYQGASPTFVVGFATDGCTNNIKVWEINPSPSFTVNITNLDNAASRAPKAYGATTTQCVDLTRAAKYSAKGIAYNYGADTLYYEVIASDFVTSWKPTFFLTGLDGTIQTATISYWDSYAHAYKEKQGQLPIEAGNITGGKFAGTKALTSSVQNTTNGVSMIVKVVITNNNYQTIAQESISLSVAGLDAVGFNIIDNVTCTIPATDVLAAAPNVANRTIDPRPLIDAGLATPIILTNTGVSVP